MRHCLLLMMSLLFACCSSDSEMKAETTAPTAHGKTLVAYYSYTGNCRSIVSELTKQLNADVVEITPVDKTQRYEDNGYAVGTALLNAIKANPNDASSYPAIDPVNVDVSTYDNIIIVTPLWWSQMAAIMQTYLFQNASAMAGKNVALIVSSSSSSINGVVADAKRLLPAATWMDEALWINDTNRSRTSSLVAEWLTTLQFNSSATNMTMNITIGGVTQSVTLADNVATQALVERLNQAPVTVSLDTNGDFEIWGPLGFSLPTANEYINGQPGDGVLYSGSNICIFYGSNSYSYTRLGRIDGLTASALKTFLKGGQSNITVTLSLPGTTAITTVSQVKTPIETDALYSIDGTSVVRTAQPKHGVYIRNGKKIIL